VGIQRKRVNWVVDVDIRGFFDNMSHEWTTKFIEHRVADRRVLRLLRKWLKAGVSEDGQWSKTELGTPQGAVVSPLLANVYLHLQASRGQAIAERSGPPQPACRGALGTTHPVLNRWIPPPRVLHRILMLASTPLILRKSRMRRRARTDLCGGRSAMVVPTATVIETWL
jgi:hypothetical protein